jgi:hypothetical protein
MSLILRIVIAIAISIAMAMAMAMANPITITIAMGIALRSELRIGYISWHNSISAQRSQVLGQQSLASTFRRR